MAWGRCRLRVRLPEPRLRAWYAKPRLRPQDGRLRDFRLGLVTRGYSQQVDEDEGRIVGPRHYPSLAQTLRNTRGRELLRIVDTAVPNLKHIKEFSIVLKALAIDGQWRRAIRLMREMREIGVEPNLNTYNQVLAAMTKDKQVDKALEMLVEMREKCIHPDIESWSNAVGACKPSEWQRTLLILDDIAGDGLEPDGSCFEHAAAACEEAGEWQRSLMLFLEIDKRGLESTSVGHNYALSACRQGKQWRHGFELMAEMANRTFEPDFRLRQDLEAQSRGLDRAPPPEPSQRSTPSPDNVWQRKQQLRELREQDKRRQEERKLEQERLEREPAPAPYEEAGFIVYGGQDAFANKNAYQMPAMDLEACKKVCRDRAFGAFTVWNGQAYFRGEKAGEIKDNLKRAAGTTLYVNLETEAERKARLKAQGLPDPLEKKAPGRAAPKAVAKAKDADEDEDEAPLARPRPARRREEGSDEDEPVAVGARPEASRPRPGRRQEGSEGSEEPRWQERKVDAKFESRKPQGPREPYKPRPKLRSPGSYVLPVFAQHDRSNHAERQALIKVIARVQEACGAQNDDEFEAECAEVTGTVRLYASHTPCISCMACFCQFQRLFPKVKLCVDFDDWRDTRRMVEMARREEEYKKRGITAPTYDCAGLSDMSDEEDFLDEGPAAQGSQPTASAAA